MEMKVLKKSIVKLKYFYLQNKYLVLRLKRLICNALTQLQLDYGGVSWFTPTKKNRKNRQMHTSLFEFTCPLSRRCNLSQKNKIRSQFLKEQNQEFKYCFYIGTELYHHLSTNCFSLYPIIIHTNGTDTRAIINTRAQIYHHEKKNTGQQALSFLGPKLVINKIYDFFNTCCEEPFKQFSLFIQFLFFNVTFFFIINIFFNVPLETLTKIRNHVILFLLVYHDILHNLLA